MNCRKGGVLEKLEDPKSQKGETRKSARGERAEGSSKERRERGHLKESVEQSSILQRL